MRVSTHRTRAAALAALPPGEGYRVVRWYHAIGDRRDRPYSVWVGLETTPRAVAKIKQDLRTVRRAAAQLAALLGIEVRIESVDHKVVERITKWLRST